MKGQTDLGLQVETLSDIEVRVKQLLREYRTMPAKIKLYERMSQGIGLIHEPSVTAGSPREDDPEVLDKLKKLDLSEQQERMVDVVTRVMSKEGFTYAASYRVANRLLSVTANDKDDQEVIDIAYKFLSASQEERVELTQTERLAILREEEIQNAKSTVPILKARYDAIAYALDVLKEYFEDYYHLLKFRYIDGNGWLDVCDSMAINGVAMTRDEYIKRRRKAMAEFIKWLPLQMVESQK